MQKQAGSWDFILRLTRPRCYGVCLFGALSDPRLEARRMWRREVLHLAVNW
jgi:hypothetical protein